MKNTMEIGGYRAVIQFDPDIEMFRGEFVGLNGGADFYARDVSGLRREGATSLRVFLEMCEEDGVEPGRRYSGRFNLRIPSELHANVAAAAAAEGKSLNQWIADTLGDRVAPATA
ncbi:MAG: type II toxin-antitoxin system HicB family antitoxin [Gemmatimonadetes bacterium]|nr:type II toxin-antitoxin system HicB family antitoxin [Candidatus Palauibacter australiensis]MCY3699476.1 type II toxin-antitoxin system HicB family antitoxin [Gemmatimonadota bacterium]